METLPEKYDKHKLGENQDKFIRGMKKTQTDGSGRLYLNVPSPLSSLTGEYAPLMLTLDGHGAIFFKFIDDSGFNLSEFGKKDGILNDNKLWWDEELKLIRMRLFQHKSLFSDRETLKFPLSLVYIFPNVSRSLCWQQDVTDEDTDFAEKFCLFKEDIDVFLGGYGDLLRRLLNYPAIAVAKDASPLGSEAHHLILDRFLQEFTVPLVRYAEVKEDSPAKAPGEYYIDEGSGAAKNLRLDKDQIGIVNDICAKYPDQLILACAGSGKTVLLLAKIMQAASVCPNKNFLILCYNSNLRDDYEWRLDGAGFKDKNIRYSTFYKFCEEAAVSHGWEPTKNYGAGTEANEKKLDEWVEFLSDLAQKGQIKDEWRYYGIFVDEAQVLKTEWYRLCHDLLESKNKGQHKGLIDHMFVICGDITQSVSESRQEADAPWEAAGAGYPDFKRKSRIIRLYKNYRNAKEINDFINRFAKKAKNHLQSVCDLTPGLRRTVPKDLFLTGEAGFNGRNGAVTYIGAPQKVIGADADVVADWEIDEIENAVKELYETKEIPYSEIAVIMYRGKYPYAPINYELEQRLLERFEKIKDGNNNGGSPFSFGRFYFTEEIIDRGNIRSRANRGVRLIKTETAMGLDFQAAIVCGLLPLGEFKKVKVIDSQKWSDALLNEDAFTATLSCIKNLYVACTRGIRELYIIAPESTESSVFLKMLKEAYDEGETGWITRGAR